VKKTENGTETQDENVLKLAQGREETYQNQRRRVQDFMKLTHDDFYKRMGWLKENKKSL